jgi:hypothetical protein
MENKKEKAKTLFGTAKSHSAHLHIPSPASPTQPRLDSLTRGARLPVVARLSCSRSLPSLLLLARGPGTVPLHQPPTDGPMGSAPYSTRSPSMAAGANLAYGH